MQRSGLGAGFLLVVAFSTGLAYAETITVEIGDNSYDVPYTGTGITITSIDYDLDFTSVILIVDVTDDATLDITFDREFFDSVSGQDDEEFIVIADGDELPYAEASTEQSRTIRLEPLIGTENIEIFGSVLDAAPEPEPPAEPVDEPEPEPPAEPVDEPEPEPPAEPVDEPVDEPAVEPIDEPAVEPPVQAGTDGQGSDDCGEGTIYRDGQCVLDDRCGKGTTYMDGECVLESSPGFYITDGNISKELFLGFIIAFMIAGIVGVVLAVMAKAGKRR